jgi:hypothetical protein
MYMHWIHYSINDPTGRDYGSSRKLRIVEKSFSNVEPD